MDEDKLFADAMTLVKPIGPTSKKQPPQKQQPKRVPRYAVKHPRLVNERDQSPQASAHVTDDPWVLRADGISRERLKQLAAGNPAVSLTLDLHGLTRNEALDLLDNEFLQAISRKQRVIAIIHGRGLHSQGKPVLKDAVYQWLRDGSMARFVLAVMPQPGSGGGACLVLLRRKV
ncbi:hypothetical protein MMIC_P1011 [Mariprofundus micogutta]|uniref:Smr domain-containing protein n=1 Tax=Mariprofundus micogutta TaxID=1921010 RepID=A0A1L8CM98_9PROT|nr:Smr/MutS family protein [Mariprofundus micogutta]GAV20050.1 hypothetical protein MMIC_P1011 [Mariprofundus micogutta]